MFAYNKNYQELTEEEVTAAKKEVTAKKNTDDQKDNNRYKVFTLEFIIKQTLDYGED